MGGSQSCKNVEPPPVDLPRANTIRCSIRSKLPMPEQTELERRFTKVLASMDLPPDKAKLLKQYDDEKKWGLICDQELVQAKDPPSHYLNKLRTYLDPKASRSYRKRKIVGDATSTQVLRDLEISLRTNHIEWVREFLNEENQGLNSLVNYLSFRLQMMHYEQRSTESTTASEERISNLISPDSPALNSSTNHHNSTTTSGANTTTTTTPSQLLVVGNGVGGHHHHKSAPTGVAPDGVAPTLDSPSAVIRRHHRHATKLKMGDTRDDIHVCIMCLRAIMNNKYGFNMVIQHTEAINCIALSLRHKSLRTKALVLELLAAICLVKGGHEIILCAFDKFKDTCHEVKRFQTLMDYFMNYDVFHVEFMVACVQFVNIVVHSVEDMNYRVHLQYELTELGLDAYLERLRHSTESEELRVQILAYLDNVFDVAALMEDSETKTAALEKVAELEDELGQAHDRLSEIERESLAQIANLETALAQARVERDELADGRRQIEEEVQTLRRTVSDQRQQSQSRQSMLEETIQQLMSRGGGPGGGGGGGTLPPNSTSSSSGISSCSSPDHAHQHQPASSFSSPQPVPPPPPPPPPPPSSSAPPPPPPPPPPPMMNLVSSSSPSSAMSGAPVPPPAPGQMAAPDGAMTIKRKVLTKHKLPTLNWLPLKPNQVRGTIFNELDDDKLYAVIDFVDFEEKFKLVGMSGGPPRGGPGGGIGQLSNGGSDGSEAVDGAPLSSYPSKRFKKTDAVSLLEHTRLRNIAISRRKIDMPVERVVAAINALDLKQISLENVEILQKMVPTEAETKAYREYMAERKDVNQLTDEDRFLMQLTKVERLANKLTIMNYMGNFLDNVHLITPQVHAIISASGSVKSSRKLRRVLEFVLAFGNYLNSGKRGPAYGFKMQSLDTLLDTKSPADRRLCLLHYLVATVRDKCPELLTFDAELMYIEKAATVSLENVVLDVAELEKNMETVRRESELRKHERPPSVLRDFLLNSEDKLRRLRQDCRQAQDSFAECAQYFGEPPRTTDANAFFALLVRFVRAFKAADVENEQRRRLEAAERLSRAGGGGGGVGGCGAAEVAKRNRLNQKKQQEAVINELKVKARQVQEKKLLHQDEVYNGALEDILLGLKSEPYRRADAVRRSQRRRIDSNRLSRTYDEIEL